MNSFILKIKTESFLLTGSGEGSVMIDTDVVFHPSGFPMIPARRIKGLLKESMEEVMEIQGKVRSDIDNLISVFFGKPGSISNEGKLIFNNLMVENWSEISRELDDIKGNPTFDPDIIRSHYTSEIQQTALENGIARTRSLRNYRVINPDHTFKGKLLIVGELPVHEKNLVIKACKNLRYAGTRRNRGFGKIRCRLVSDDHQTISNITNTVNAINPDLSKVNVRVKLLSSIVLADLKGEQNTIFTNKQISGNQIRGMLAWNYIKSELSGNENAQQNEIFKTLFLSGNLQFGDAHFNQAEVIPFHIHRYKLDTTKSPISVFAKDENDNEISKSIGGYAKITQHGEIVKNNAIPLTTFNFHNSRLNRAAGRSKESDAETGIFYYESLNEGQEFYGDITGEEDALKKLLESFPSTFQAYLGRSRSAQYGLVEVTLSPGNDVSGIRGLGSGTYIITLLSPLILFNEAGYPSPTSENLVEAIQASCDTKIEIEQVAAAFTEIEQFNGIWRSKSGKIAAYKEGSSFLVKLEGQCNFSDQLGEWTEQGFGKISIQEFIQKQKYVFSEGRNLQDIPPPHEYEGTSEVLTKIQDVYKQKLNQTSVKQKAIEAAQKSRRPNNHQIGRLERLFKQSNRKEDIDNWIDKTQNKPAGDALKKAGLVNQDHKFDLNWYLENLEKIWGMQQLFWITYFQTLRKLNKKDKRDA